MPFKLAMRSESWVDRQLHDRKGRFRERIGKPKMSKEKSKVLRRAWQGEKVLLNYSGRYWKRQTWDLT